MAGWSKEDFGSYTNLYAVMFKDRLRLDGLEFNRITAEKIERLERPVLKKEVVEALNNLNDDKALWRSTIFQEEG